MGVTNFTSRNKSSIEGKNNNERKVIREIYALNGVLLIALLFSSLSHLISFAIGFVILGFIALKALNNSMRALMIFLGIKLMLDAYWFIQIPFPGVTSINLLDISIIPIIIFVINGPRISSQKASRVVGIFFIYFLWLFFAKAVNEFSVNIELLIRQSGLIIGMLLGFKYIRNENQFDLLIRIIFISTTIPVIMSLLQLVPFINGLPIFHVKLDTIRGFRYCGLYYDPATNGMVNIISLIANAYLINKKKYSGLKYYFLIFMIFATFINAAVGGTRSILIVILVIASMFFLKRIKNIILIAPLILAAFYLTQPYLERIMQRTSRDVRQDITLQELLENEDNRGMFTGRASIWQQVWKEFKQSSFSQKMVGSGKESNAHSIYFYLLLQIGALGILFFIAINSFLLLSVLRMKNMEFYKPLALSSLSAFLILGFSATTILYTSFQWIIFINVSSVIGIFNRRQRIGIAK